MTDFIESLRDKVKVHRKKQIDRIIDEVKEKCVEAALDGSLGIEYNNAGLDELSRLIFNAELEKIGFKWSYSPGSGCNCTYADAVCNCPIIREGYMISWDME